MMALTLSGASRTLGISLIISLAFGLGQCGIGALMLLRGTRLGGWRSFRALLLAMLGAGFALSGVAELVVSGAEALGALGGMPRPDQIRQVRLVADDVLAIGLAAVALALALYPVWRRILIARTAGAPSEEPS